MPEAIDNPTGVAGEIIVPEFIYPSRRLHRSLR